MNNVLSVTNRMIYEKWIKLTDMCRTQVDLPFQKFSTSYVNKEQ